MFCLLKQFQTLAVGIVGFTGVILTLAMNARLSRMQHARQVQHDAQVLRAALIAELEVIREAFRDRVEIIDETLNAAKPRQSMLVPLDSLTDVYTNLVGKIGLLSERESRAVVRAYVLVRQLPERVKLLSHQYGDDEEKERGWARVDGRLFDALKTMHENYLKDVDAALVELQRLA
jgi:hypothetical protein